jgi:hypothetical protein
MKLKAGQNAVIDAAAKAASEPWWWASSADADEATVMREIVCALGFYGWKEPGVDGTVVHDKFFLRVGQRNARGAGSTKGVPDLLVSVPGLPFWLGFELKARNAKAHGRGRLRAEQRILVDAGVVHVARSWGDVMQVVRRALFVFKDETLRAVQAAMTRK